MQKLLLFVFLFSGLLGCGGLEPIPEAEKTMIYGTVVFKNGSERWPPADSVKDFRVVAFLDYPPKDIIGDVLSGRATFTQESLPTFVDSLNFSIEITQTPLEFKYIAAAWNYGTIMEWKTAGVYSETKNPKNPSSIILNNGDRKKIRIYVDFDSLPPQPDELISQ